MSNTKSISILELFICRWHSLCSFFFSEVAIFVLFCFIGSWHSIANIPPRISCLKQWHGRAIFCLVPLCKEWKIYMDYIFHTMRTTSLTSGTLQNVTSPARSFPSPSRIHCWQRSKLHCALVLKQFYPNSISYIIHAMPYLTIILL